MSTLNGKKIVLGITGSIAAYKSAMLVRLLVKAGAEVRAVMTRDAALFITPLTISTLSKNQALTDLVDDKESMWVNHVKLGLWGDLMLVAPASANTLAKFANGICDNLLTAVYLSARCPVVLAPAMDEDMWKHPSTQKNISALQSFGNKVMEVEKGELASGLTGEGRMAEPETILNFVSAFFSGPVKKKLSGKRALVTAGPTYEAIDPVRFIGNHSSGKMGVAIAEALADEGAQVQLILGPSHLSPNHSIKTTRVTSADEMYRAAIRLFKKADITVMAAAVADFKPAEVSEKKIKKKKDDKLNISLTKTRDILKLMGEKKKKNQFLAGFALETDHEKKNATEKLIRKNLDMIVLNSLNDEGAGFQHDTNKITIIDRKRKSHAFPLQAKQEVAKNIVNFIIKALQ